jgi:excisionase family DNA binding protein
MAGVVANIQLEGKATMTIRTSTDTIPARAANELRRTMFRVEDLARRWDLNVKTIYAMIERGELSARRFGRVLRVPRSVVDSLEQASVPPTMGEKSQCR